MPFFVLFLFLLRFLFVVFVALYRRRLPEKDIKIMLNLTHKSMILTTNIITTTTTNPNKKKKRTRKRTKAKSLSFHLIKSHPHYIFFCSKRRRRREKRRYLCFVLLHFLLLCRLRRRLIWCIIFF